MNAELKAESDAQSDPQTDSQSAPQLEPQLEAGEPVYLVVMNDEQQFSIWPDDRDLPLGWIAAGKQGTKAECLEYIDQVWTDMRPRSLRERMDSAKDQPADTA